MTARSMTGDHGVYWDGRQWRYEADSSPAFVGEIRECTHCHRFFYDGEPDPCLGRLPGVKNACCGHSNPEHAYIQFHSGVTIRNFGVD